MIDFLQVNAPVVSAAASVGTLAIWAIYLHIFVLSYQRQLKPMLVINLGEGRSLDAKCFVTNMSRDPVHIQSVVARLATDEQTLVAYITDAEDVRKAENPAEWERMTRLGPVASGTMVNMGSCRCILDYAVNSETESDGFESSTLAASTRSIEITILGIYGTEDLLVGASRRFNLRRIGKEIELRPADAHTHQITNSRERKALAERLAEEM